MESAVREITSQLAIPEGDSIAIDALEELSLRFLDRCLDPVAYKFAQRLIDQIQSICDALTEKPKLLTLAGVSRNLS